MNVLVDTPIWIDYFKGGKSCDKLDLLINTNSIFTCGLILAELVPLLIHKKQSELIKILYQLPQIPVSDRWEKIIQYQAHCLGKGFNHMGIPDLMLMDTVVLASCPLYSLDKHFLNLQQIEDFDLY